MLFGTLLRDILGVFSRAGHTPAAKKPSRVTFDQNFKRFTISFFGAATRVMFLRRKGYRQKRSAGSSLPTSSMNLGDTVGPFGFIFHTPVEANLYIDTVAMNCTASFDMVRKSLSPSHR